MISLGHPISSTTYATNVRRAGYFNEQFALSSRDFLRSHPDTRGCITGA